MRISITLGEVTSSKRLVTGDASFADRVSLGFAMQLAWLNQANREDLDVLFQIQHLEQGIPTTTKPAKQFRRTHPFGLFGTCISFPLVTSFVILATTGPSHEDREIVNSTR